MTTALLFSIFVVLFLLHVPIAISLAMSTILIFTLTSDFNLMMIPQRMFAGINTAPLMAIPGYVLAGVLMSRGGVSKYLIECLKAWIGHLPGGLSVVTILACTLFAAISGSSPATAAAIGAIMLPAMLKGGYPKRYTMGLIAASGTLGILIPPSIPLIVYGVTSDTSIGKLFMAGIIPGLILASTLVIIAIVYAKIHGYGQTEKATWSERWKSTIRAIPASFLPVLILGSIYAGICTPTEAAVVAVFYTLIISLFVYKELRPQDFRKVLVETINTTSMIFLIIAAAMVFALFLTNNQVPNKVAAWIGESSVNIFVFFLLTQLMFFVMGTFLEAVSIILITLPILLPIMRSIGIDPIHFAIVMTVNMELAMITPPVGLNLFVVSSMAKEKLGEVVMGVLPFILVMIVMLIVLVVFPELSLMLPTAVMK
ncbi:C4-dicarboxylate transporter DctM subunit [Desulfitobacterium sp. LBE]|uniref:TRAP C4-dicarboxylate transport system permease DctM subunit domain-containing protein n=4 Tax=Desulfitobacterium hafniense TaxID=49338 RepID=Q24PJ9_DESHY|nr:MULTISPECIES: TRAP transporter large permease subunit [Desulfitobacterium]ACL19129.1 TRAP dicarboxylate transporter, DctM subunit [Desulfitobacterium hafniense DCB-2]EHL06087.1 TRAP transporter, DctM subunit [Desulfitobacterium hafniense DP7]KTE93098.1 C4-dicarboxylate ABC transporter permease [Desulfitobacterium hafniense]TWH57976.1 C4-dicarboxylate transporter DctM subunit [Desulfitobacterium sp. LBE]CDX04502.1 2,3-diketo-L-gulonate TRAP transporter large permease protein YiaN [Desulfitob